MMSSLVNTALGTTHVHRSTLLELPAEIRNRICQYVLTTSKGSYLDPHDPSRFLDAGSKEEYTNRKEFNLLKFTCHQLYKETAGIEIKLNRVEFLGPHESPGSAQAFNDFLSTCTPSKAQWLREVTLYFANQKGIKVSTYVETEAVLSPVLEFCRNNPHANVRYMPPYFSMMTIGADQFIMLGVYLSLQFRGNDLRRSIRDLKLEEHHIMEKSRWLCNMTIALAIDAPNFPFWPRDERLDQEKFRKEMKR